MEKALNQGWSRVYQGTRALIRQVAAAVYVFMATALGYRIFAAAEWLTFAIEPVLTFLAGFILGTVVEGPRRASHLVGVFVALIHLAFILLIPGEWSDRSPWALVLAASVVIASGTLGAHLAYRRRARAPQS